MSPSEIAAYIGAAAWIPQILGWVYKVLIKPKVELIPAPTPEVGYTTFGPIFNMSCAISASRHDAVIQKIKVMMRHERGQSALLTWVTLNETFSQIRNARGETAEISKNQPAIALKVSTQSLVEKVIGFQDLDYHQKSRELSNRVLEVYNHFKTTEPNYAEQTIKSPELAALLDFYKKNVFWQEGTYTATVDITLTGVSKPTIRHLNFSLSRNDVDRLNANVSEMKRWATELFNMPDNSQPYLWNWVYPRISQT